MNWLRIIRFAFGGFALIDGLIHKSYLGIFIGAILLYQAIKNVGCAGGSCAVDTRKTQ